MQLNFQIENKNYCIDTEKFYDISIALKFNKDQPNIYNVEKASSKAYEIDNFVGDTRRGGGCNFESLKIIPHCNGTHTECIGHLTHQRISIHEQLKQVFIPATLISIRPLKVSEMDDTYKPSLEINDLVISKKSLEDKLNKSSLEYLTALVIRTMPNSKTKTSRNYMDNEPPFFTLEAMQYIADLGVEHLLIDLPSVDRAFDEGKLNAHHIFWNIKEESHEIYEHSNLTKTITEMIYVSDEIKDGKYLLNLQIAPFVSDATPSRPILFKITEN